MNSVSRPLVYIAGPYTGPDPILNTHNAVIAGMRLWEEHDIPVVVPHLSLLAHIIYPMDLHEWYALDLHQLERCDALLRLPGPSDGADQEVAYAKHHDIPVFTTVNELLMWVAEWGQGALHRL